MMNGRNAQTALFLDGLGGRHGLRGRFGRRAQCSVVIRYTVANKRIVLPDNFQDVFARFRQFNRQCVIAIAICLSLTNFHSIRSFLQSHGEPDQIQP